MITIETVQATLDEGNFEKAVRYHEAAKALVAEGGDDDAYNFVNLTIDGQTMQSTIVATVHEYAAKAFVLLQGDDDVYYLVTYQLDETGLYDATKGDYWLVQARASFSSAERAESPSLIEVIGRLHQHATSR